MWENSYSGSFVTKGLEWRSWFGSRDDCGHGLKKPALIAGREPASSPTDHVQRFTEASIHHRGAPTPDRYDAAAAERCVTCCFGEFDEILCNFFGGQSEIILKWFSCREEDFRDTHRKCHCCDTTEVLAVAPTKLLCSWMKVLISVFQTKCDVSQKMTGLKVGVGLLTCSRALWQLLLRERRLLIIGCMLKWSHLTFSIPPPDMSDVNSHQHARPVCSCTVQPLGGKRKKRGENYERRRFCIMDRICYLVCVKEGFKMASQQHQESFQNCFSMMDIQTRDVHQSCVQTSYSNNRTLSCLRQITQHEHSNVCCCSLR